MAKRKAKTQLARPLVAGAFFCERVIQEQDGVLTIVRIIDTLYIHQVVKLAAPVPVQPPVGFPTQSVQSGLHLVVLLKSGDYRGQGVLNLRGLKPSGEPLKARTPTEIPVELKGGHYGANVVINLGMPFELSGIYWFELYFDGHVLTRMPLSVVVSEQRSETEKPASEPAPRARRLKVRRSHSAQ